METLDIWKDVHPSIVTIPMEWGYTIPYGIVYAKQPDDRGILQECPCNGDTLAFPA